MNESVVISLSGLIKSDATVEVVAGNATAFKQNVTFIPPSSFVGASVVECDVSDGNKVIITVGVLAKPVSSKLQEQKIRTQTRETTMAGLEVEDRHWKIVDDSGPIEGPSASFVPLKIAKVTALSFVEEHPPEEVLTDSGYFSTVGVGSFIELDLGTIYNVAEIDIDWRGSSSFSLDISSDRKSYHNIFQGKGFGLSNVKMAKGTAVLIKITTMTETMEIYHISVKGSPMTPKATSTGAQAILKHSSQIVEPGQLVTIDGSDSRGDITRYVWDQSTSPVVQLFNDKTAVCSFVAPEVVRSTTLQISLTVVDRNGQYSKAESLIYIEGKPRFPVGNPSWDVKPDSDLSKLDKFYKENPCCRTPDDIPEMILLSPEAEKEEISCTGLPKGQEHLVESPNSLAEGNGKPKKKKEK